MKEKDLTKTILRVGEDVRGVIPTAGMRYNLKESRETWDKGPAPIGTIVEYTGLRNLGLEDDPFLVYKIIGGDLDGVEIFNKLFSPFDYGIQDIKTPAQK